jgi:outer membrane PBP1 activator LpoA protein
MHPRLKKILLLLNLALLAALLGGCETAGVKPKPAAYTTPESGIQQAEVYMQEAATLKSPQKDATLLLAAQAYMTAKRPAKAENALAAINKEILDIAALADYTLLYAQLALASDRFFLARQLLGNEKLANQTQTLPPSQRLDWHLMRGELYSLLGDDSNSIFDYARAAFLLDDAEKIGEIHDKIWQLLSQMPDTEIVNNAKLSADEDLRSWYQLALIARETQGDIALQVDSVQQWQQSHRAHPAAKILPNSLQQAANISKNLPKHIALLLPGSGDFLLAAETIRDGVLAAYYEVLGKGGTLPSIRLYDTNNKTATALYQEAIDNGADLVIGPLRKEKLAELMALESLPVPVLGLNYLEDATNNHNNLYQFGLSINDEATEIAERAWVAGHRTVLAITPQTGWGDSALNAFQKVWQKKGGRIATTATYSTNQRDYTQVLEPAFLVKHSQQRAQKLRQILGKTLVYTPKRRRDLDMIFLVAYPQNGRQIKPTLDYLYAADLPVYATSHIYDGTSRPAQNSDLDGVTFSAMPWTIKAFASGSILPRKDLPGNYRNLFAMGTDAYRLHQWLELLKALPGTEIHGYTGSLSLGAQNQIVRKQPWGMFRNGVAVPAPALASGNGLQ